MKNSSIQLHHALLSKLFAMDEEKSLKLDLPVRMKLVRNMRLVREASRDIGKVKDNLIRSHGNKDSITPEDEGWEEFQSQYDALMELDTHIELQPVELSDLNPEENQLPLSVIDMALQLEELNEGHD